MIKTVGVVGLGLIGGSVAKAIRAYTGCTLYGCDTDGATLSRAVADGTLTGVLTPERLKDCDLVVVALYPQAAVDYVRRYQDRFRQGGLGQPAHHAAPGPDHQGNHQPKRLRNEKERK